MFWQQQQRRCVLMKHHISRHRLVISHSELVLMCCSQTYWTVTAQAANVPISEIWCHIHFHGVCDGEPIYCENQWNMVPYSCSRSLWWWNNILWKSVKYGAIFTVTEFVTVNQYIANFNMMQHCTTKQRQCLTVVQKITLTRVNTIMQMITSEERDMEWNKRIGKQVTSYALVYRYALEAKKIMKTVSRSATELHNCGMSLKFWLTQNNKVTIHQTPLRFPDSMETPTKIKHTSYC